MTSPASGSGTNESSASLCLKSVERVKKRLRFFHATLSGLHRHPTPRAWRGVREMEGGRQGRSVEAVSQGERGRQRKEIIWEVWIEGGGRKGFQEE